METYIIFFHRDIIFLPGKIRGISAFGWYLDFLFNSLYHFIHILYGKEIGRNIS